MISYKIGIYLGATNIRVGIGDEKLFEKISERTKRKPREIMEQIIRMVNLLLEKYGIERPEGIGIGSIGPLDLKKGCLVSPSNLPIKLQLVNPLKKKFKVPYIC